MNNDLSLNIYDFMVYIMDILGENGLTYEIYDIPNEIHGMPAEMHTLYCDVFGHEHRFFEVSNIKLLNGIKIIFDFIYDSKNDLCIGIYLKKPPSYSEETLSFYLYHLNLSIRGYELGYYENVNKDYNEGSYDYYGEYQYEGYGENSIVNQKCSLEERYIKIIPFGLYKSMELNWKNVRKFLIGKQGKQGKNICKKCLGKIIL